MNRLRILTNLSWTCFRRNINIGMTWKKVGRYLFWNVLHFLSIYLEIKNSHLNTSFGVIKRDDRISLVNNLSIYPLIAMPSIGTYVWIQQCIVMGAKGAGNPVGFMGSLSVSHIASIFQPGCRGCKKEKVIQNDNTSNYISTTHAIHTAAVRLLKKRRYKITSNTYWRIRKSSDYIFKRGNKKPVFDK